MVDTPSKQTIPPASQGPGPKLPKIDPMELATAASQSPKYTPDPATSAARKDVANSDKSGDNKFSLPEKVTQKEIRDNSFKYGGGRSAGNRSIQANKDRKENEQ